MNAVPGDDDRSFRRFECFHRRGHVFVRRLRLPVSNLFVAVPDGRNGVLRNVLCDRVPVEDDGGRSRPPRRRVFERQLDASQGFGRRAREPVFLRHAVQNLRQREAAVVAAGLLIRSERRIVAALARLRQDDHRRGREARLHLPDDAEAADPRPLPGQHCGLAVNPAVHLGHHAPLAFVARPNHVHARFREVVEQFDDAPARIAEHILHAQRFEDGNQRLARRLSPAVVSACHGSRSNPLPSLRSVDCHGRSFTFRIGETVARLQFGAPSYPGK